MLENIENIRSFFENSGGPFNIFPEMRRQAMLQLYLSDHHFYCQLKCDLNYRLTVYQVVLRYLLREIHYSWIYCRCVVWYITNIEVSYFMMCTKKWWRTTKRQCNKCNIVACHATHSSPNLWFTRYLQHMLSFIIMVFRRNWLQNRGMSTFTDMD